MWIHVTSLLFFSLVASKLKPGPGSPVIATGYSVLKMGNAANHKLAVGSIAVNVL